MNRVPLRRNVKMMPGGKIESVALHKAVELIESGKAKPVDEQGRKEFEKLKTRKYGLQNRPRNKPVKAGK